MYEAARQHLSALVPSLERLHQFSRETEHCWRVADSIVTGEVERSVVDGEELAKMAEGTGDTAAAAQVGRGGGGEGSVGGLRLLTSVLV